MVVKQEALMILSSTLASEKTEVRHCALTQRTDNRDRLSVWFLEVQSFVERQIHQEVYNNTTLPGHS